MRTGRHLIAGTWVPGTDTFASAPVTGDPVAHARGTPADIDAACRGAEAAFAAYAGLARADRATFLDRIATEIEARGPAITAIGTAETGLPPARLEGERGRTTGQLRLFADHIRAGAHLDRRVDGALPDRTPLPRPEIRMIQRPVGPVGVFGASNFPLAFSTAGGDTASALAAGCLVVVKGHPAHPGTSELVAQAIDAAIRACGMPAGIFSLVQGDGQDIGAALVQHPLIRAVGFTGSLRGGRALFDLCAARPAPIPFYGELGSVNPMFLMPAALAARGGVIAAGWAASLTLGAGQFCTNPGIAIVIDGPDAEAFAAATATALGAVPAQTMLTTGIAAAYRAGHDRFRAHPAVSTLLASAIGLRDTTPALFSVSGDRWRDDPHLGDEVFGPLGLIVRVRDMDQMHQIAARLEGQLTCTLHVDPPDHPAARALIPVLERKAGRLLANGFPTGVEVCDAQVHGGPYPASTNFGATSVGTLAIRRWLRPVAFQNIPEELLGEDLA
ncbi:MAG: aldehyde dehydrogenase (NADP(+)) [Gemmobacter sp.]